MEWPSARNRLKKLQLEDVDLGITDIQHLPLLLAVVLRGLIWPLHLAVVCWPAQSQSETSISKRQVSGSRIVDKESCARTTQASNVPIVPHCRNATWSRGRATHAALQLP
jgi:hypothetical protein